MAVETQDTRPTSPAGRLPGMRIRTRRMVMSLSSLESRCNHRDQDRSSKTPASTDTDVVEGRRLSTAPATRRASPLLLRQQPRIDRNEGGGEHSFTEEVLQEVGDLERRIERIGRIRGAQIMGKDPVSDQAENPAQQIPAATVAADGSAGLPGEVRDVVWWKDGALRGIGRADCWRNAFSSWSVWTLRARSSTSPPAARPSWPDR